MARPAWPPPMTTVSTLSITAERFRRLLRLESSCASRATPFDELLLQERLELIRRRTTGFECLFFKLLAYLRSLQDDVHPAREPLHDILWRFRRCEQAPPRNNGKAWHSRFGDRRYARKQGTPHRKQGRERSKFSFLDEGRNDGSVTEHHVHSCIKQIRDRQRLAFVRNVHHIQLAQRHQLRGRKNSNDIAGRIVELARVGAHIVDQLR